ncbi:MAG: dihydropteroate synthase, partial [Candidatus Omnitrophica bacterium]|nr:dihydropteroate synthase [Candidatus Omnitrophota bacterium]
FAVPVPAAEELRRIIPVIERLAGRLTVPISVDTQKAEVARAALEAGAGLVNDIAANRADNEMHRLVAETGAAYVVMHMQGTPQTMQINPVYRDVAGEVRNFLADRLVRLERAGVQAEQVVLDVGIGFGKTVDHNLELIARLKRFVEFGRPLLLGVSRKSFIGQVLKQEGAGRLPGALACTVAGIMAGVNIVRTHDVPETLQAIRMTEALMARQT